MARLAVLIAPFAYVGYFPVAPGTAGSAAALVLYAAIRAAGSSALEIAAIAGVFAAGTWAATEAERAFGRPDPGPVVIDEVLGMLVTLALVPVGLSGAVIGFLLFRVFDVIKPWPINRLEELPKGLGIMSDDLLAGVYANVTLRVVGWLMPGWVFGG
jgi:phosphatidylglycerophosphatase A